MRNPRVATITAALECIKDANERRRVLRLIENRERLAAAAAVFEAHHLGDQDEIRRVQYLCEAEIAFDHPQVHRQLEGIWTEHDLELAHDGVTLRSRECPICDPANPGLAELRRMAA